MKHYLDLRQHVREERGAVAVIAIMMTTLMVLTGLAFLTMAQGNGQLENVIRFLENWNGKNFNYNGSIIALWHSQQATGDWRCCGNSGNNYYRPPNRNWAYDPLFDTNIPPGTPRGILTMKVRWSQT